MATEKKTSDQKTKDKKVSKKKTYLWLPIGYILSIGFLFGTRPGSDLWRLVGAQYRGVRLRAAGYTGIFWLIKVLEIVAAVTCFAIWPQLPFGIPHHNLLGSLALILMGAEPLIFLAFMRGLADKNSKMGEMIAGATKLTYLFWYPIVFMTVVFSEHEWIWLAYLLLWCSFIMVCMSINVIFGEVSSKWFPRMQTAVIIIAVVHLALPIVWPSAASYLGYKRVKDLKNKAENEWKKKIAEMELANMEKVMLGVFQFPPFALGQDSMEVGHIDNKIIYAMRINSLYVDQEGIMWVHITERDILGRRMLNPEGFYVQPDSKNFIPWDGKTVAASPQIDPYRVLTSFSASDSIYWVPPHALKVYFVEVPAGVYAEFLTDPANQNAPYKIFNNAGSKLKRYQWVPANETWRGIEIKRSPGASGDVKILELII